MRDFGNLPVVDQGDAYLSINGNCSSADPVLASETAATVATVATVGAARWQPEIGFIL